MRSSIIAFAPLMAAVYAQDQNNNNNMNMNPGATTTSSAVCPSHTYTHIDSPRA
jgi:hypothetical protein